MKNGEVSILDSVIPDELVKVIYDLLVEVQPKHIDEVTFYDVGGKPFITIFPAVQVYMSYSDFETDKEWLKKSNILVKKDFKISEIGSVRAYSEEVDLRKTLMGEDIAK